MRNHQTLMNEVYNYWKQNDKLSRHAVLVEFSPLHKAAVQLGNLNYQVENGGFSQWHFNNYSEDLDDLLELCEKGIALNIRGFELLRTLLETFGDLPDPNEKGVEEYVCNACGGKGFTYDYDDDNNEINIECEECGGTGIVEEEYDNWDYFIDECDKLDKQYYAYKNWLNDYQELLNRL